MSVAFKTPLEPSVGKASSIAERVHRFTVEQYEQMGKIGILKTSDRVELLEGWIIDKMTQNPPHNIAIDYAHDILRALLSPDWRVREQKAIRLTRSLPEPDLVVVKGPLSRYEHRHPIPSDIMVIVEVADSSLDEDRGRKQRLYA